MNHNDIRHKLSEYMDGTLTSEEKTLVEEHLKTCPDCSNALMELRKTVEHIRKVEEVEPPAWMTQKIMARVRAEEEKKKQGLFQRIFFPLHVKLPLEAIGVLFIAVTVYFVVQDVQRKQTPFPEAPVQTYSTKPTPTGKGTAKEDKDAKPADSGKRTREAPQEPGYKALDMKQEYEKPKPPAPAPTPESMRPAEEQRALKRESPSNRLGLVAPESMQDQVPAKEFSGQGAASQAPTSAMAKKKAGTARAEISSKQMLTLVVSDLDQATARVEDAVKEYGGKIIRKEPAAADGALSLTVSIDVANRNRFIDRLKTLGELKDKDAAEIHREGTTIEIRIVKQAQQN